MGDQFTRIRALLINMFLRSKRMAFLYSLVLFMIIILQLRKPAEPVKVEARYRSTADLVKRRQDFKNPVYDTWQQSLGHPREGIKENVESISMKDKCELYFNEISTLYPGNPGPDIVDLEDLQYLGFDRVLYKKIRWIKTAKKELRKKLREQGQRFKDSDNEVLEKDYETQMKQLSKSEDKMVQEFNHMRVFGKCFVDENFDSDDMCSRYQRKLYPWLSNDHPTIENWKGEKLNLGQFPVFDKQSFNHKDDIKCLIQNLKSKSNGRGLVIPLLPDAFKPKQIKQIGLLIRVLRALKNNLPIEITYVNDYLTTQDKKELIYHARTEISGLPDSYKHYFKLMKGGDEEHHFSTAQDFPKQNLWFVDMSNVMNKKQHPLVAKSYLFNSPNFVLTMSAIFNTFEDVILLSPKVIPLIENFGNYLFDKLDYQKYGQIFFKSPTKEQLRMKNVPGFQEVKSLIEDFFTPNSDDKHYFGIHKPNKMAIKQDLIDGYQGILDDSMIVINKVKHMSGLLIACNLQLYGILNGRFEIVRYGILSDFILMGLDIAGTNKRIHFNENYGVNVGVLTPFENKPFNILTLSHELCSSSWGQVDGDDWYTLIYVTTHQLENWLEEDNFRTDLENKFVYKAHDMTETKDDEQPDDNTKKVPIEVEHRELFDSTIGKNPLYIQHIMRPPRLSKPVHIPDAKEPKFSWQRVKDFSNYRGHGFWCSYDIVGSSEYNQRGSIIELGETLKARYNYLFDAWMEQYNN